MVSKKLGCPLSSIFQQWIAQHQRQEVDAESLPSPPSLSYRILLQTSYSLKARITAAEPVENPHLYKRAGLVTPPEQAIRDIHGAGETAWLLRLVELATQRQQKGSDGCAHSADSESIIYLTTKIRPQGSSVVQELPQDIKRIVQVVDLGSRDPFRWDEEGSTGGGNDSSTTFAKMDNLQQVYQRLKMELDLSGTSRKPTILIWQSLTPLIVVHGFKKVLRLLCALPPCLQVWPVNSHSLTQTQHAQLEDASNAILHLHGGEMNIIRQGIRERGNVLRQKLPFRLEPIVSGRYKQPRFRVVVEVEDKERMKDGDDDCHLNKPANSDDKDEYGSNSVLAEKTKSNEPLHSNGSSRGAPLLIEENDGGRNESATSGNNSSEREPNASFRPRIYMQDDDCEFDDFDEEDPDDDLDI